jgi:hypothetical protein
LMPTAPSPQLMACRKSSGRREALARLRVPHSALRTSHFAFEKCLGDAIQSLAAVAASDEDTQALDCTLHNSPALRDAYSLCPKSESSRPIIVQTN